MANPIKTIEWQKKHWDKVKAHKLKYYYSHLETERARNNKTSKKWLAIPSNKKHKVEYIKQWRIKKQLNQTP